MAREHQLPAQKNRLLLETIPPHEDLVSRRRLGQTQLTGRGVSTSASPSGLVDTFYYAHLRVNLPKGIKSEIFSKTGVPPTYFLMQRCTDGYVSATGMFKAVFPSASLEEEANERDYVRSLPATSSEETAGNTWISPEGALALAEEYDIKPWILALLDPADIAPSGPSDAGAPAELRSPPKFNFTQPDLALPTPGPRRSRRSMSPAKSAAPKRAVASPRKRRTAASSQSSQISNGDTQLSTASTLVNGDSPSRIPAPVIAKVKAVGAKVKVENIEQSEVSEAVEQEKVVDAEAKTKAERKKDLKLKVHVEEDIKEENGEEVKRTKVDLELPLFAPMPSADDAAHLIAEAKAMVKQQKEDLEKEKAEREKAAEKSADSEKSSAKGTPAGKKSKNKRTAEKISQTDKTEEKEVKTEDDEEEATAEPTAEPSAKRTKTEAEVRKTKMRKRAFYGIGATLAVGALVPLIPFVMSAL